MTVSGLWEIVVPEATKNYIANPSYEASGAGSFAAYTANSGAGTLTQSSAWQARGVYSLLITKNTDGAANARYGVLITGSDPTEFQAGESVTFSVDVNALTLGANNTAVITLNATGGEVYTTNLNITHGSSGRYSVTAGPLGSTGSAMEIYIYITGDDAGTLYLDGFQLERKAYATTYCDGTIPGCAWTGRPHYSTSTRSAQERSGGRVRNLTDVYGLHVTSVQEIGYPPTQLLSQQTALLPGATYIGEKINPRVITLSSLVDGSSRANLHEQRKDVIDLLKSDLVNNEQPVTLRYTGAHSTRRAEITAYLDAGLGFNIGANESNNEINIPLRLIAYDPFWKEDGNKAVTLDAEDVTDTDYIFNFNGTAWSTMDGGANNPVYALELGPDGKVYAGGLFTTIGGVTAAKIAAWNQSAETFAALGDGLTGGAAPYAFTLLFAPNGDLYAGGVFTTAGSVTANHIAKWDTLAASPAWTALQQGGSGTAGVAEATNPQVLTLALSQSGSYLYVGGNFTTAGGIAAANIASWNFATQEFAGMGTAMNSGSVRALAVGRDGTIYAGGTFTGVGVTAYDGIAYYDTGTSDWLPLSTGVSGGNAYVYAMAIDVNGDLIIGGDFTTAGGVSCLNVARWNGSSFSALGAGLDDVVYKLIATEEGIYAFGKFDQISPPAVGTGPSSGVAFWNRSVWTHIGVILPASSQPTAGILIDGDRLIFTPQTTGNATTWGITSVNNTGTRSSYPVIKFKRSGGTLAHLELIRNRTTGATLYFSYYLQDGEELTIDLTPGSRSCVSSFYGTRWDAILRNSDVGAFNLQPGTNQIETYVWDSGDPTITATMEWRNTHWSADGVAA